MTRMLWSPVLDSPAHADAAEHRRDRGRLLRGDRGGPHAPRAAAQARGTPAARAPAQTHAPPWVDALLPAGPRAARDRRRRDLCDVHDAVHRVEPQLIKVE